MENIRAFFNMVEEYLTHYKEIIEYKSDFYKYPTFGNLDYYDTCDITYKIASKLFSMNNAVQRELNVMSDALILS